MADIGLDGAPRAVSEGSFLLPSGTTDLIWILGDGAAWVAQLDPSTGAVGERFDVSAVISWPEGGLESGLLVRPVDEATFGQVAHWTPHAGLRSVAVDDPHSRLLTAAGTRAVFLSPDNTFQALDVVRSKPSVGSRWSPANSSTWRVACRRTVRRSPFSAARSSTSS